MTVSISTLMCHAPIVIPEIAGNRARECARSTVAMEKAAEAVLDSNPDTLILISPHSPRRPSEFGVFSGAELKGDFSAFGFSDISMKFKNDEELINVLMEDSEKQNGIELWSIPEAPMDHGACVPLFFIHEAGWLGPTVVISLSYQPSREQLKTLGSLIKSSLEKTGKTAAIIASGDMSHRLMEGAPAGFHPSAVDFDSWVKTCVKEGSYHKAWDVSEGLRDLAAEDVLDTLEIASSVTGYSSKGMKFLNYEGPFGVGYLVSVLFRDQ